MPVGPGGGVEGDAALIRRYSNAERRLHGAARKAVSATTRRLQLGLRAEVQTIFTRNQRAANAIRSVVYDNSQGFGNHNRADAAGIIFSKFGRREGGRFVDFLAPYLTGRNILPRRGKFLAVPLRPGKRNRVPRPEMKLRPVKTRRGLFLVKQTRTRTLFMFLLIPFARIRRRLRLGSLMANGRTVLSSEAIQAYGEVMRTA